MTQYMTACIGSVHVVADVLRVNFIFYGGTSIVSPQTFDPRADTSL